MIRQLAPGMVQQMQSVCSDCNGEGTHARIPAFSWNGWEYRNGRGLQFFFFNARLYSSHTDRVLKEKCENNYSII